MKTLPLVLFLALAQLPAPAFAQGEFLTGVRPDDQRAAPAVSAPQPAQNRSIWDQFWGNVPELRPLPKKKWTIMVFMNGKNDLKDAMLANINMMEVGGSNNEVNVVAELGKIGGLLSWGGSRRLYITKDADTDKISSTVLMKTKKVDLGDYKRAVDFVKWAKQYFPAEKYMFIISNHGSGFMDPRQETKGISFDDETGNYIRTKQIGQLMREAGGADILAYDACLMQMGEVLAETGDSAKIIVGAEETIPGLGFPYHTILPKLAGAASAESLAALIVRDFAAFYKPMNKGVHLSAIRSDKLPAFYAAVKDFTAAALNNPDDKALKTARDGVLRFDMIPKDPYKQISFYGDLYDFAGLLRDSLAKPDPRLAAAADRLQRVISGELVIENSFANSDAAGKSYSRAHGVAAYMAPVLSAKIGQEKVEAVFEARYGDYEFAKLTGWHALVTRMYKL
ncbi:MAG: clostripain-related cysteine peptidase [Elusimicrobiales bacterium]|nr:clostripain-related cysteine peptidase [Elusimicrobiales bacterium]